MATKAGKTAMAAKMVAVAKFPDPPDARKAAAVAKLVLEPSVNAAAVVSEYSKETFGDLDMGSLVAVLSAGATARNGADMKCAEAMLFGQAQALQAIFTNFARRAPKQELMSHWDAFMRVALKAQNQCRMTLETLATIKNPPVVFARQANINNGGQQQVNNGSAAPMPGQPSHAGAHAANPATAQTGLLGASDGEWMDARATGTAGGADPHMEAVGAIDRAANGRGQGPDGAQR